MARPSFKCANGLLSVLRRTYSKPSQPLAFVSHIEVEHKFVPTEQLGIELGLQGKSKTALPSTCNAKAAPSLSFTRLASKVIVDIYYDLNGQLARHGIWIRRRTCCEVPNCSVILLATRRPTTTLEAKVRLGGDYANSQFQEIKGESNVRLALQQHTEHVRMEDLLPRVTLSTHRRIWAVLEREGSECCDCGESSKIAEGLTIVLDDVEAVCDGFGMTDTFKHHIGEVELTREVVGGDDEDEHEQLRLKAAGDMDESVEDFMARYADLFLRSPKPKGKLSAYFGWEANKLASRVINDEES